MNEKDLNLKVERLEEKVRKLEEVKEIKGINIAGFIAIAITAAIIYIIIFNTQRNIEYKIPEILSNALATILGFYFGSLSQNKK